MNDNLARHADAYLDAAPDAILIVDSDGVVLDANTRTETMFGYSPTELIGQHIELLVPAEVKTVHRAHRTRFRVEPRSRQMGDVGSLLNARRADGSLLPVEIGLSPVEVDGGMTIMAVVRDVSERVTAEAANERIRRSLDAIDDAVFMFDAKTLRFSYVNEGAVRQVGYDRAELLDGMTPLHLEPTFTESSFRDVIRPLVEDDMRVVSIDTAHRRKDGLDTPVEVNFQYPGSVGDPNRSIVAIVRDVTRRVEADAVRARAERLRRIMAEIRMAALDDRPGGSVADLIVSETAELTSAVHVALARLGSSNELILEAQTNGMHGPVVPSGAPDRIKIDPDSVMASVLEQGEAIALDHVSIPPWLPAARAADLPPMGAGLVVPVLGPDGPQGILAVARAESGADFDDDDLASLQSIATEAATASKLSQARLDRRQRTLAEDRERIARDLHDHVIQRMFATGMRLQGALASPDLLADRSREAINELDEAINVIRESIFKLTSPDLSLFGEIDRVIDRHRAVGRASVDLSIDDDLSLVPESVGEQLVATLNELLSNVSRHADAEHATVSVEVIEPEAGPARLELVVVDDGAGFTTDRQVGGLGLRNITKRAEVLGGSITIEPGTGDVGTIVNWTVPLPDR